MEGQLCGQTAQLPFPTAFPFSGRAAATRPPATRSGTVINQREQVIHLTSNIAAPEKARPARKRKLPGFKQREQQLGYLFILPFAVGFLIFHATPALISFIISATNMRFLSNLGNLKFVGLSNFIELFQDAEVMAALGRSFLYSLMYVPIIVLAGLLLAVLVNCRIYARGAIRTALFMPYISNMVAIAIVWSVMLDYRDGPINQLLRSLGCKNPPMWLMGEHTALLTIVLIAAWQGVGLYMVTYLAALQNVPQDLYEAATLDGAGSLGKFLHITVPLISPTTFFLLITAIIGSFQNFGIIQVLTKGGPGDASTTMAISVYNASFEQYRMGYATAQAVVLFVIILLFTVIQWQGQKRWVTYD